MTQNPFDSNPFDAPAEGGDMFTAMSAGGGTLIPRDIVGHVLIVKPTAIKMINTASFGEKEAIICSVADLDGNESHHDVAWFNGRLIGTLKKYIGRPLIVKMAQGEAKAGQSAPFQVEDMFADATAKQRASAWVAANPGFFA